MAEPTIIRPELSDERKKELNDYLQQHWRRALEARQQQVDNDYARWDRNYFGIPAEKVRTVPFYKSSNFVVKLIRMFLDTFVARTLNIVFATRPLYVVDGFPAEVKEALEFYVNRKALYEWHHYKLFKEILFRGNKNGTSVTKVVWDQQTTTEVTLDGDIPRETAVITRDGPDASVVPFEDWAAYPITANCMSEVLIKFHRVRYPEEKAKWLRREGIWELTEQELESALKEPADLKREQTQVESGVQDRQYRELQVAECHTNYAIGSDPDRLYSICGVIQPDTNKLIDCYYNPFPLNQELFYDYRPFPREDFIYGESMCELLEQGQEESSCIHNERRNNAAVANAPVWKRRSGSLVPNPSTNWYPGKVFDLDDMDDLQLEMVGRNYDSMLDQENYVMQLSERLSGIGAVMQGYAAGMMGKRGIYNAAGTIALLQESNQRQDTNIRDAREVLSAVAKASYMLQARFGRKDDPTIGYFPDKIQEQIRQALIMSTPQRVSQSQFEVKASTAGANKEVERQNLMALATVLAQYGQQAQQLVQLLANPKVNQSIRLVANDVLSMHRWMAQRLLRAYDELDVEGVLPDVRTAIETTVPGGGRTTADLATGASAGGGMELGEPGTPSPALTREGLAAISGMVAPNGGAPTA